MKSLPSRNNDGASAGAADRQPPQNLEAERGALCACLIDPESVDVVVEIVRPSDFYRDSHQMILEAVVELRERDEPTDAIAVEDVLRRLGRLEKCGGSEYLWRLAEAVPHSANASFYAGVVRDKSIARQLLDASTETIREIYSHQYTADTLVCNAEAKVFAIGEREAGQAHPAEAFVAEAMVRLDERRAGRVVDGLAMGFEDLDGMTGGLQPGSLSILAARPSQGKTSLACDILLRVAARGEPVLFMSLEMGRGELADRMLAAKSGVDGYLIREAQLLKDKQHQALYHAAQALSRMPFRIDDGAVKTVSQIAAQARRTRRRFGLSLLVIDYLGLIDGVRQRGESRQEEVARISRGLKAMAKMLRIPVLALHQLNRKSEDRDGRRPMLADLRDSGQLEADADLVLLLHRPEFYDPTDRPGEAELIVAKNRNGATGPIRLSFQKSCTRFDSFAQPIPDSIPEGQPF